MKKIFTKEFIIGLSVIIALLILFFGIDYLKGINLFKPANFYYASYEKVDGLAVAAPVNIEGFKVGQVRELQFDYDNPGKIKVLLSLDKKLHIPEDSFATIESTLLSGAYIAIHLGKSKSMLPVGSELKASSTKDLMASVTEDIMPSVNSILPKVDSLLANLNALVADPKLSQSIGRLDGITLNVLGASQGFNTLMRSNVPLIARNVNHVVGNLDSVTVNLGQLSYQLKSLPLQATMQDVNNITTQLSAFSEQLNNKNSTLGLLTTDPELYYKLNRVSADIDSLIVDIKKNPKRYISIKLL